MTQLSTQERLVKLETLMQQALDEIKEMRREMKESAEHYTPISKHESDVRELNEKITELRAKRWVENTLSAMLGAVLSGLIGFVLLYAFGKL